MKKNIIFSIVLLLLLCSCSMSVAESFNYEGISNGQNNFLAGGKMAFKDNTLYLTTVSDFTLSSKTFAINNQGVTLLNETKNVQDYIANTPVFYQTKDKIYICTDNWYEIDTKNNNFEKADSNVIYKLTEAEYSSDDLVIQSVVYGKKFNVKYKNKKLYTVKQEYRDLCVGNDKIYFVDFNNGIYFNNPEIDNGNSQYLTDTLRDYSSHLSACGGYVYYNAVGDPKHDTGKRADSGLYCYSEKDKAHTLVIQGDVNSINCFEDMLFVATQEGVYKCKKDKATKLCDEKADEIYILDKTWVYGLNNTTGKAFRVAQNGSITEVISFSD